MSRGLHSPLQWLRWIARNSKRIVVFLLGTVVLGSGLAMLVMPGPGVIVIIAGLAILATEFAWAERALDRTTTKAAGAATKVTANAAGRYLLAASGLCMIIGGAIVMVVTSTYRLAGTGLLVAGVVGLATLVPAVQRWIERAAQPSAERRRAESVTVD